MFKILVSDIPGPEFQLHKINLQQNKTFRSFEHNPFLDWFLYPTFMLLQKITVEQLTDPFVNARPTLCSRSKFTDCTSLLLNTPAQKWVLPCTEAAVCRDHESQCPRKQQPHAEQYFQHSWQHSHLCLSESSSTVTNWMHKNANFFNRWHFIAFLQLNISKDNSANPTTFYDENSTNCYNLLHVSTLQAIT